MNEERNIMKCTVGLWIDYSHTIIVRIGDDVEKIHTIISGLEKRVQYSEEKQKDQKDRSFRDNLGQYYTKVITHIHDGDAVLIMGPSDSKYEFEKKLIVELRNIQIVGIETAGTMTDSEVSAKARGHT